MGFVDSPILWVSKRKNLFAKDSFVVVVVCMIFFFFFSLFASLLLVIVFCGLFWPHRVLVNEEVLDPASWRRKSLCLCR